MLFIFDFVNEFLKVNLPQIKRVYLAYIIKVNLYLAHYDNAVIKADTTVLSKYCLIGRFF